MTKDGNSTSVELSVWKQYRRSRSENDRQYLLQLYEPLVRSLAARAYRLRVDDAVAFDDYLQYARLGLIEAIGRFDCDRGIPFSAFANARIRGSILNGLAKETELAAQNRFWRAHARERMTSLTDAQEINRSGATLSEMSALTMGLAIGIFIELGDVADELIDPNLHSDPYAVNELQQLVGITKRLICNLPSREREVISGHYIQHQDFKQIADAMGLTKGRVSQLHSQAVSRLREWIVKRQSIDRKL